MKSKVALTETKMGRIVDMARRDKGLADRHRQSQ